MPITFAAVKTLKLLIYETGKSYNLSINKFFNN